MIYGVQKCNSQTKHLEYAIVSYHLPFYIFGFNQNLVSSKSLFGNLKKKVSVSNRAHMKYTDLF